jgi:AcrR family transcriptional regulator
MATADPTGKRPVGRPRQYDDDVERELILDAAYAALRDTGHELTIAGILASAGVSTRSFYRHFASKDALLCAMYLRDGRWAADRLTKRLADAASPPEAVAWWIDEIFSFVRTPRRAERVSVLGSIASSRAEGFADVAVEARQLLVEPLRAAVRAGIDAGVFGDADPDVTSELLAAAVLHAAGLVAPYRPVGRDALVATTRFCLEALGGR